MVQHTWLNLQITPMQYDNHSDPNTNDLIQMRYQSLSDKMIYGHEYDHSHKVSHYQRMIHSVWNNLIWLLIWIDNREKDHVERDEEDKLLNGMIRYFLLELISMNKRRRRRKKTWRV